MFLSKKQSCTWLEWGVEDEKEPEKGESDMKENVEHSSLHASAPKDK